MKKKEKEKIAQEQEMMKGKWTLEIEVKTWIPKETKKDIDNILDEAKDLIDYIIKKRIEKPIRITWEQYKAQEIAE